MQNHEQCMQTTEQGSEFNTMTHTCPLHSWTARCPRCISGHCKGGGQLYTCRKISGSDGPRIPRVPSLDDCVPGSNAAFFSVEGIVYCDSAVDFYAADELPDYARSDYSRPAAVM